MTKEVFKELIENINTDILSVGDCIELNKRGVTIIVQNGRITGLTSEE